MRRFAPILPMALALVACSGDADPVPLVAPLGPVPLVDIDPDPNAIEVDIIAGPAQWAFLPGKPADVWAYRDGNAEGQGGRVPGPMLLGKVGDPVTVPLFLLGQAARDHVSSVFNGEGGDQLFGGWATKPMIAAPTTPTMTLSTPYRTFWSSTETPGTRAGWMLWG